MSSNKQYIQIEGEDFIEFRCSKCKADDTIVKLPKKGFDSMEEIICFRCCSRQTSGC